MCAELDRLSGDMNDRMRRIHRLLDVPKLVEGDSSWMRGVDMICQRVVLKETEGFEVCLQRMLFWSFDAVVCRYALMRSSRQREAALQLKWV